MTPPPPIPDRPELFCSKCHRWKPRRTIVAGYWLRAGLPSQQAAYRCAACQTRMESCTKKGPHRGG